MPKYMYGVFFKPWVGDKYRSRALFAKRVLVQGESHYQWDENIHLTEDLTIECVEEQISGAATHPFWTKISVAFLNKNPSVEEKREFWHSVAFYKYVQASVGLGPKIRPTDEMWAQSERGFLEILRVLAPQCIIVLGCQLWECLPSIGRSGPYIEGAEHIETWRYPIKNKPGALAYGILHPSSGGFSGRYWYPFIMQAIAMP